VGWVKSSHVPFPTFDAHGTERMMLASVTHIRVRYADTDQMKFVYYSKYLEYFEQGRSDLLRHVGMPYPEIEKMGYYLPVVEAYVKYRQPARYDELLDVRTVLNEMPTARIRISYEIRRADDSAVVAEGYTVHSIMNSETGKPVRAPQFFVEAISHAMRKSPKKNEMPQEV
jgi:acyl-CoA thioester hydrolase